MSFKAELNKRNISIKKYMLHVLCLIMSVIIFSSSSLVAAITINDYIIVDGETVFTVYTTSTDPAEILATAGVTLKSDDEVFSEGNKFIIKRYFNVILNMGEKNTQIYTSACTVEDVLNKAGVVLNEELGCSLPLDKVLRDTTFIDVAETVYTEESVTESIPYTYVEQKTDTLYKGKTEIAKYGSEGQKKITYKVKLINGKEVERTEIKTEVLKEAVTGIKLIGTRVKSSSKPSKNKIEQIAMSHVDSGKKGVKTSNDVNCISTLKPATPIQLDANGVPVNAKYSKVVQATGYHENHGGTATGVRARPGYIAVNPEIIPYGTKMYIVSTDGKYVYGYAVAADTGGFIKSRPTNVDLNFATEAACKAFGRRNVIIYFL